MTQIGRLAFFGCGSLEIVKLSRKMTRLENSVFTNCYSLKSITIPKNITYIGAGNFQNCTSLKTITFENPIPPSFENNWSLDKIDNLETIYVPKESVEEYKNSYGMAIYKNKIKALP